MSTSFLEFTEGAPIVITGAGSGIGEATAKMAADNGLHPVLWDMSEDHAVQAPTTGPVVARHAATRT